MMRSTLLSLVIAATLLGAGAGTARAQDSWDFRGFIYLWGASLGGSTTTGQDVDLSFSDILEKLDFGIMGALEANRGQFSLFGDAIYLSMSDSRNAAVGPGIPAQADADISGFVFTGSAGYDVIQSSETRLTGFGGFRYINLDTTANISLGMGSQRVSGTLSNLDAVVGLRGIQQLSDRWALSYYADIGTGESDLTWQAALTLDYRINSWDLSFGYRHMAWEVSNSDVLSDIVFSGPFIGAKFRF